MKVTTDACIQGAWTPLPLHAVRTLDIGAGTGLLSLMLAQRDNGAQIIDAVELDEQAAMQAAENAAATPWAKRINVVQGDIMSIDLPYKYDLIVTNPPFFINSLLGPAQDRNTARHTSSLSYLQLLQAAGHYIAPGGYLCVLLPYNEYQHWVRLADGLGWHACRTLYVTHRPEAPVKRVIGLFSREKTVIPMEERLTIKGMDGEYTTAFKHLLAPYYLHL